MLLSLITQEMRHVLNNPTFLTRPVDTAQHRAVCDFCAGTIFSGFWFCTKCGRDYCLMCERYISDTVEKLLESPWPVPDKSRARLQRCSRGEDSELPIDESFKVRTGTVKHNHSRQHLQPVSRFTADEVVSNWTALVEFVLQPGEDVDVEERLKYLGIREDESELAGVVREWFESHKDKTATAQRSPVRISETELEALYDASKGLQQEPDPANLGSLPFMFVSGDRLDNDLFDHLWSRGEPLVVDGLAKRFLLDWTPNSFIRRFGPEPCFVVDCQTEMIESMLIGQFFTLLKDPTKAAVYTPPPVLSAPCREATRRAAPVKENGDVNMDVEEDEDGTSKEPQKVEQILKLKDWPATNDFSDAYPDLYDDFCRGLPVPDYTARNGVMNLYSHVSGLRLPCTDNSVPQGCDAPRYWTQDVQRVCRQGDGWRAGLDAHAHGRGGRRQHHAVRLTDGRRVTRVRGVGPLPRRGRRRDPRLPDDQIRRQGQVLHRPNPLADVLPRRRAAPRAV